MEYKRFIVTENGLSNPEAVRTVACATCGAVLYCPLKWNGITMIIAQIVMREHVEAYKSAKHKVYIIDPKTRTDHTDSTIH